MRDRSGRVPPNRVRYATIDAVTHPLRYFSLWRAVGWLLVVLVVYLSLTPAPPSLPMDGGDKLGHVLAYAALMAWFSWLYAGRGVRLVCAVGFLILGIGLEFAQALTDYRSFQLADMGADCVGVALGWVSARPAFPNLLVLLERPFAGADVNRR